MNRPPLPSSPRRYPWYPFPLKAERLQGYSAAETIKSMKISNDPIGNRVHQTNCATAYPEVNVKARFKLPNTGTLLEDPTLELEEKTYRPPADIFYVTTVYSGKKERKKQISLYILLDKISYTFYKHS